MQTSNTVDVPVKRILCPVDFSVPSTHALHYALSVASWFDACLSVVHVHRLHHRVTALVASGAEHDEPVGASESERDQLAKNLRAFVSSKADGRWNVNWHLDESPNVAECIVSRARALKADLIVVGTHGRAAVRQFLVGSTAERVLRSAPCAVLAVPPHAPRSRGIAPCLERVLCAVDFSEVSGHAVDCAAAVANRADAALTIAHIVELPPEMPDLPQADLSGYRRARFQHARTCMQQLLAEHPRGSVRGDELLLAGRAGPELLRLACEQQSDLLVMGVHARRAADLFFFGSVTHHVIREAPCPVLTVRN